MLIFNSRLNSLWVSSNLSGHAFCSSEWVSSRAIELEDHEKRRCIVNGQRLKYFYMGRIKASKVEVLQFKDVC